MTTSTLLSHDWFFTQVPSKGSDASEDWLPCSVPTDVHSELIKANKIRHPYKDLAEWESQWIPLSDWIFKTTFHVTASQLSEGNLDLVFEGLDTFCDISLNGQMIAKTDNMFISHRINVRHAIREGPNELALYFHAPKRTAHAIQEANGGKLPFFNGSSERAYARKAQYHWGWDWGPVIICVGPWLPVTLEHYTYRLDEVCINANVIEPGFTISTLSAMASIDPKCPSTKAGHCMQYTLKTRDGHIVKQAKKKVNQGVDWQFQPDEVGLWYPRGYGEQSLYILETALTDENDRVLASDVQRVGFRHVALIQEPLIDQPGSSFVFQINGIRIFCGGSNWIPGDNFLTQMAPETYRSWVELMVKGNQNMLRIWGGGIYESPALYNACDELGVLVWQDFMFGCAVYPSYTEMNRNIKSEAEAVIRRLRQHPSIVLYAGNNEDYQVAENFGVVDYNDNSGDYMGTKFPARHIYENLLPEVVSRLCNVEYVRSSPYGGENSYDTTVGDSHQWNVWHGTQEPYTNWDKLICRFVSEFGMQGYPDRRTVAEWTDDKEQLFPQSRISVNHNKAGGFERRIELYLMENYRHAQDMASYIYYTQVMQAECISMAYRLWRREWKGPNRQYCAGALVWQLNDCWPCVSWAICDYRMRPKPAFFAMSRELQTYTIGVKRELITDPHDDPLQYGRIHEIMELWGCNSSLDAKRVTAKINVYTLEGDILHSRDFPVELAPNVTTEIWKDDIPGQIVRSHEGSSPKVLIVQALLLDESGVIIHRHASWPHPFKYIVFPEPDLKIDVDQDEVRLSCSKPVKSVVLDVKGDDDYEWTDQDVDLFPNDPQTIVVKGLNGREVTARYLGDGSA
ncbi:glycoside hydrolase superfamily [Naematelia encephala]|uniref:Beta-mannosidase B n=1 Tax=Naematelia encephala TaxID=71784 RepID=A0A1Y2AJ12_9TREE|nr:glycoside hydrolase superfamily [Naematelia encephala]